MNRDKAIFGLIFPTIIVLTIMVGGACGGKKFRLNDQPSFETKEKYELVWVEPQIIYSDSIVTLIKAARLDSILITSSTLSAPPGVKIAFVVSEEVCNVSINLGDSGGHLLRPIFIQNLSRGNYQLTLHYPSKLKEVIPLGSYHLEADYCGKKSAVPFIADR